MSDLELGRLFWSGGGSVTIVSVLVTVIVIGQICKRAGFSRWWSLLTLIPVVGSLSHVVFAVVPWPVEQGKRRRKDS